MVCLFVCLNAGRCALRRQISQSCLACLRTDYGDAAQCNTHRIACECHRVGWQARSMVPLPPTAICITIACVCLYPTDYVRRCSASAHSNKHSGTSATDAFAFASRYHQHHHHYHARRDDRLFAERNRLMRSHANRDDIRTMVVDGGFDFRRKMSTQKCESMGLKTMRTKN